MSKLKEIKNVVQKLSREQDYAVAAAASGGTGAGVWTATKTSSHPQYTGVT